MSKVPAGFSGGFFSHFVIILVFFSESVSVSWNTFGERELIIGARQTRGKRIALFSSIMVGIRIAGLPPVAVWA